MAKDSSDDSDAIQRWEVQLRKGCLELAVLASLWSGRLYGLEILRRVEDDSGLLIPEGTVYPLLSRLKEEGWVGSEWVESDAGHPRKYYRLTAAGKRHVLRMARGWASFAGNMNRLIKPLREEDHS